MRHVSYSITLCVPRCTYFPLLPLLIEPIRFCILLFEVRNVGFIISIALVIALFREPDKIAVLFGATGLTTAGLISVMQGIWKEKVAIEMTIALLENIKPESLESIIQVILTKF